MVALINISLRFGKLLKSMMGLSGNVFTPTILDYRP